MMKLGAIVLIGGLLAIAASASGQSSDALLNKLVEKGILTSEEAKQLKVESDKNFTTAYSAKSGIPEWVSTLKFTGDFRGRYNVDMAENDAFVTRNRWRYRARFGVVATLFDDFEVGLRLGSGDLDSGVTTGTSPLTSYQTFQNNAAKKGVFIDQAYGRWSPLNTVEWKAALTLGKMADPFVFSEVSLGMDPDYTPEGIAIDLSHQFFDGHTVRWINGAFVLDELATSGRDPFLFGSQLRVDSKWSKRISTSVGAMWFAFVNTDQTANNSIPNANVGNWRIDPSGTNQNNAIPQFNFNTLLADASLTYQFDHGLLYPGAFPVKLVGSYMNNPSAPSDADNHAWSAGVLLGKAGRPGAWELAYQYKWLGANAVWEEVVDDDFGGYWATTAGQNFGRGDAAGFFTGTNARGHVMRLSYSVTQAVMLSVRWYHMWLIDEPTVVTGVDPESGMDRFMLDVDMKF
jgi:hypothetical protein